MSRLLSDGKKKKMSPPENDDPWVGQHFEPDELRQITDNFSSANFVMRTHCANLYRGKISVPGNTKAVAVKIILGEQAFVRLENEVRFLWKQKNRNIVKLIGYCEDTPGLVYDVNPMDTLYNLIPKDSFTWKQRVRTAVELAQMLSDLHNANPPYLLRSLNPSCIMVDRDGTPIVFEFDLLSRLGMDPVYGFHYSTAGYVDLDPEHDIASDLAADSFTFGVLLLDLITKSVFMVDNLPIYKWALRRYNYGQGCSLVDESFGGDPTFHPRDGRSITDVAVKCVGEQRPAIKEVIESLKKLRVRIGRP